MEEEDREGGREGGREGEGGRKEGREGGGRQREGGWRRWRILEWQCFPPTHPHTHTHTETHTHTLKDNAVGSYGHSLSMVALA